MTVVDNVVMAAKNVVCGGQGSVDAWREFSLGDVVGTIVSLQDALLRSQMALRHAVKAELNSNEGIMSTDEVVQKVKGLESGSVIVEVVSPMNMANAILDLSEDLDGYNHLAQVQRDREKPWLDRWRIEARQPDTLPDYGEMLGWLFAKLDEYRAAEQPKPVFRHYKGLDYILMGYARHTETRELMAIYRSTHSREGDTAWARPSEMFFDNGTPDGRFRFALLQAAPSGRTPS